MRTANVYLHDYPCGVLEELEPGRKYGFQYDADYEGQPISLTLPVRRTPYEFSSFPAVFDGLLPEGDMLEGLLRNRKLDRTDLFGQLLAVGRDLVGAITVEERS